MFFRPCNKSTQHRPCLTRNLKRSNSGFHILANLIRRGLEKLKILLQINKSVTCGKSWNHYRNKHKIKLVAFQCNTIISSPPKTSRVTWQVNMDPDLDDEYEVIHEFSVVKCCFCYLNIFEFKYIK